jgi:hypothetical protein
MIKADIFGHTSPYHRHGAFSRLKHFFHTNLLRLAKKKAHVAL